MKLKYGLLICLGASLLSYAFADPVQVDIDRYAQKYNLGISALRAGGGVTDAQIQTARKTLIEDLEFSGAFQLVTEGPPINSRKDAAGWSTLGMEVALGGMVSAKSGRFMTDSHLYDTGNVREVLDIKSDLMPSDPRILGHEIANQIFRYFTGQEGIFNSKLVYVNDRTGRKELYITEYDGRNPKRLTNDNSIVILPRISPNGKKIIFTSYRSGNPDLYIMNTDGTERKLLSSKAGLNVSPSWSPDNEHIAITLSHEGPPNIYLMNLQGQVERKLTDSVGADTAPSFSPDGTQFSFTSDRAGAPHIFIVGLDGTGIRRITTEGYCDSSAWSPDSLTLLYVKGGGRSTFDIYSIEVLTGVERRLTWGNGDNENPTWAPDSRHIIFISTRRGKSELFVMAADGADQKPLSVREGQSFTPHWSR